MANSALNENDSVAMLAAQKKTALKVFGQLEPPTEGVWPATPKTTPAMVKTLGEYWTGIMDYQVQSSDLWNGSPEIRTDFSRAAGRFHELKEKLGALDRPLTFNEANDWWQTLSELAININVFKVIPSPFKHGWEALKEATEDALATGVDIGKKLLIGAGVVFGGMLLWKLLSGGKQTVIVKREVEDE